MKRHFLVRHCAFTGQEASAPLTFDCDGTLVDSETLGNQVLVEFVAELGLTMACGVMESHHE